MRDLGQYTAKMTLKKEDELREIVVNSRFEEEARLAAIKELKKRGIHEYWEVENHLNQRNNPKSAHVQEDSTISGELPDEMLWIVRFMWISAALSSIAMMATFFNMPDKINGWGESLPVIVLVITLVLTLLFTALFIRGFKRKMKWTRWLYFGLTAYSSFSVVLRFTSMDFTMWDLFAVTARMFDFAIVMLLLRPVLNEWFGGFDQP